MKRQISCLIVLITMLLFGAVGVVEGAAEAVGTFVETTTEVATRVLGDAGSEAAINSLVKIMDTVGVDEATEAANEFMAKAVTQDGEKLVGDALQNSLATSFKTIESNLTKIVGGDLTKLSANNLVSLGSKDLSQLSGAALKSELAGLGVTDEAVVGKLVQSSEAGAAALEGSSLLKNAGTSISKGVSKAGNALIYPFKPALTGSEETLLDSSTKALAEEGTSVETRNALREEISSLQAKKISPLGKFMKSIEETPILNTLVKVVEYGGGTMAAAVLFMIPSIFQSAFLAQQQKDAMLETYLPPTKFGNIVLQLPDSVINVENPASSQFIYYGIPVANPGDKLSAAAAAAYPGISGPTASNKLSEAVSNSYAQAFSLGSQKGVSIPRYNLTAAALSTLPIFVSYTDQSWSSWAANGIPDAAFTQTMINLNTGYVFYADGTSQGTASAPLVGAGATGTTTVESFLATKYGELENASAQVSYTQYVNSYSGSKAGNVASPIANQFNCSCLEQNSGVLSANTMQGCSTSKSSSCLLTSVLNQIAAGLVINSQGTVMTPNQDLATELANGGLGQVIPIQGYGNNFNSILQMFPGAQQNAIANSGVLTISLGTNLSSATPVTIQGAPADNYAAKGVYIYQCQNTPLAKILKSQAGGSSSTAYNNVITDYIVFLDQNLNQVPMMTPVQNSTDYNFITMGLNPAIAYVSTIIGNVDSSGNFSFLPQLNIQSPAALVAKGLPASFPPLYGLQAKNGSLAVNYNQNLPSTIGTIAQSLSTNPKLGQQFQDMQAAMLRLLTAGPYGKYNLVPVDPSMQPVINGVNLIMYTGFNSYPVPQDATNAACSDILIPLSAQGKTVTLPSNNVAEYYGLVTDLTYTVNSDGTFAVGTNGFANSPLSQQKSSTGTVSWSIDPTKASQFYWINKLTAMGQTTNPSFAMPQPLISLVTQARSAWIQWVQSASGQSSNQEYAGSTVTGTSNVLTIVNQQALSAGLYIYTCSPNPSNQMQDYFVLTNSSTPSASDATLGLMNATSATATTNMLSLISGQLYNSSGAVVGTAVNPTTLIQSLYKNHPQGFSNSFKAQLNVVFSQSTTASQAIVYPFMFGNLQLGIYQADLTAGNYLYLNAAGAGASANFQPTDYLVCIDSYTSPVNIGTKLSSATQFIVSLVSGQVYGPAGAQAMIAPNILTTIIAQLSPTWRTGVAQQISSLSSQLATVQQNQQQQTAQMSAAPVANSGMVTWPQSAVVTIIANLVSQNFLPSPHNMIKQDPTSHVYVIVSPASTDGTQFMYTFLDVPNSFVDGNGHALHVGAAYDGQGNLLRVIQGVELASLLQQYGVAIDSSGKQYLGANNLLPIMQLASTDLALKPGVSGTSMIYSNDAHFPSTGIVSPIMYQNSQNGQTSNFYIYFNNITQAYYAMQVVNGTATCYIDMAGGNVYNLNGSPQMALNPVGINSSGSLTDLFLPYLDPDNFTQCVMQNHDNKNLYSDFLNLEANFQAFANDPATNNVCGLNQLVSLDGAAANVNIAQLPFPSTLVAMPDLTVANQYNVYWDQSTTPVTYSVNSSYQWQNLEILPVNMSTRAVLNPLPASQYNYARLVFQNSGKNNAVFACIFGNQLYNNPQATGKNGYTLTSGANSITLSMLVDSKTNVSYVAISAGGITYNYQYTFLALSTAQLQYYQNNAWKAQTVADITGRILLENYLPIDNSGNLQLSPVSMNAVVNPPADAGSQTVLSSNLANIMQDSANNRFLAQINASTYAYFPQNGFVDLADGVLFSSTGMIVGYTLQPADFIALLQQLTVSVVSVSSNQVGLRYNASANSVTASSVSSSPMQSSVNASGLLSSAVSSGVGINNSFSSVSSSLGSVGSIATTATPAVAALQAKNAQLQANISQTQAMMSSTTPAARKVALQNTITIDQQQIAANNQQIATLQSSMQGVINQGRSTLLGRLSSKIFKKKNKQK